MKANGRPTLDELKSELRRGGLVEVEIRNPDFHVDGYCDSSGLIAINPHVQTVLTILHELTHRAHPRMGEKRVQRESLRILQGMSGEDIARFYLAYQRRVHRLRKPVKLATENIRPDGL